MATKTEQKSPSSVAEATGTSCYKKKSEEETSYTEDVIDFFDVFVHASMDEHKSCFNNTIQKMTGRVKDVIERMTRSEEADSHVPLLGEKK